MNCFLKRGRTLFSIFQSSWLVEQRFFLRPPRSPRPCRSTLTKASSFGRHQHRCSLAAPSRSMLPPLGFQRVSERLTRENGTKRREAQAISRAGTNERKAAGVNGASALLNLLSVPASQLVMCTACSPEVVKGLSAPFRASYAKLIRCSVCPFFVFQGVRYRTHRKTPSWPIKKLDRPARPCLVSKNFYSRALNTAEKITHYTV